MIRLSKVENSWERLVWTGRMLGELNQSRISRLVDIMRGYKKVGKGWLGLVGCWVSLG